MTDTTDPVTAEIAAHATDATLTEVAGRWVLTMIRELRHPAICSAGLCPARSSIRRCPLRTV
jgi:hypothetical protein